VFAYFYLDTGESENVPGIKTLSQMRGSSGTELRFP
jgi:hypothetical protein